MHARQALRVAVAIGVLAVVSVLGCFSFGELTGGTAAGSVDAAQPVEATNDDDSSVPPPHFDAGTAPDGAPITFESCADAHAIVPSAPDGFFPLSGVDGGPTVEAYCDMTNDNGGWMLVTPDLVVAQTHPGTTVIRSVDANGGLVVQNYANDDPCGSPDAGPTSYDVITFSVDRAWAQIRAWYGFNGLSSCWSVFGSADLNPMKNTLPFDLSVDTIYDQMSMGGITDAGASNTFDGVLKRCDGTSQNFWQQNVGTERSATLILRRDLPGAAGLATSANCLKGVGPGTTAATWWEYRDIYVR